MKFMYNKTIKMTDKEKVTIKHNTTETLMSKDGNIVNFQVSYNEWLDNKNDFYLQSQKHNV